MLLQPRCLACSHRFRWRHDARSENAGCARILSWLGASPAATAFAAGASPPASVVAAGASPPARTWLEAQRSQRFRCGSVGCSHSPGCAKSMQRPGLAAAAGRLVGRVRATMRTSRPIAQFLLHNQLFAPNLPNQGHTSFHRSRQFPGHSKYTAAPFPVFNCMHQKAQVN